VCTREDLCVSDSDYLSCQNEIRQDLITTTAAIAALSSFLMGALANLPVGLAPGLGLNAYVSSSILSPWFYYEYRSHDTVLLLSSWISRIWDCSLS